MVIAITIMLTKRTLLSKLMCCTRTQLTSEFRPAIANFLFHDIEVLSAHLSTASFHTHKEHKVFILNSEQKPKRYYTQMQERTFIMMNIK